MAKTYHSLPTSLFRDRKLLPDEEKIAAKRATERGERERRGERVAGSSEEEITLPASFNVCSVVNQTTVSVVLTRGEENHFPSILGAVSKGLGTDYDSRDLWAGNITGVTTTPN